MCLIVYHHSNEFLLDRKVYPKVNADCHALADVELEISQGAVSNAHQPLLIEDTSGRRGKQRNNQL